MGVIDYADYVSLIDEYAQSWAFIGFSTTCLENAVDIVVGLGELDPELDMLQDVWDTYSVAVSNIKTEGNLVQGIRSIQAHILKRSSDTSVSDWWENNRTDPADLVPGEWADLSEYAGYTYDSADIGPYSSNPTLLGNLDYILTDSYRIPLGVSASLASILSGLGATLPDDLIRLAIIPEDSTKVINYNNGAAATALTPVFPAAGENFPTTKTIADAMRFFAAAATYATLQVFIPRG